MSDSSGIAAKAREVLEGITPGPWMWCQYGDRFDVYTNDKCVEPDDVADVADNVRHLADAEFIAAAPELVDRLLAALETAETERDQLRAVIAEVEKLTHHAPVCTCDGAMEIAYVDDIRRALGGVS